jgi:hypothetical protein
MLAVTFGWDAAGAAQQASPSASQAMLYCFIGEVIL